MGDAYRARDTRLDRIAAVKVSKENFSERVEREARAAAALNHPHICTLHDVGPNFLVMERDSGNASIALLVAGQRSPVGPPLDTQPDRRGFPHGHVLWCKRHDRVWYVGRSDASAGINSARHR